MRSGDLGSIFPVNLVEVVGKHDSLSTNIINFRNSLAIGFCVFPGIGPAQFSKIMWNQMVYDFTYVMIVTQQHNLFSRKLVFNYCVWNHPDMRSRNWALKLSVVQTATEEKHLLHSLASLLIKKHNLLLKWKQTRYAVCQGTCFSVTEQL